MPEKILLAASDLEDAGETPFSAEALIVSAWQQHPRAFGLKGFTDQYPDSNKVLASIMGERGLTGRGWLAKMGQKLYSMTREGRQLVRRLRREPDEEQVESKPTMQIRLPDEQDMLLQKLVSSTAYEKFRQDRKRELNFADACRFWDITEHLQADVLEQRLEVIKATLDALDECADKGDIVLRTGQALTTRDAGTLVDLSTYLEDRFSRHLMLLRNRAAV